MISGELVWVKNSEYLHRGWGIVTDRCCIYLEDGSKMVSWFVLINGRIISLDLEEVITFSYYNKHLYDNQTSNMASHDR